MLFLYISMLSIYVIYVLIIVYIIIHWKFDSYCKYEGINDPISISIVIAVRNEALNLPALLQSIQQLNYRSDCFEIILINDHSSDQSVQVAAQSGLNNLRVIDLPPGFQGKKQALTFGIQKAKHGLIACTDADCVVPANWLFCITNNYKAHQWKFCAMPVKFHKSKSYFGYFQTMDFLGLMGVTYVANTKDLFYMANGANMAFTKSAFDDVNGFETNLLQVSGDDMYLIKSISDKFPDRVETLFNQDVLVKTLPQQNLLGFLNQRFRWGSKNRNIKSHKMNMTMLVVWLASFLLIVQGVLLVISRSEIGLWFLIGTILTKLLVDYVYLKRLSYDLIVKHSIIKYFASFIINTLYTGIITPLTSLSIPVKWKQR